MARKKLNKKVALIAIVLLALVVVAAAGLAYRHFYHRDPERNLTLAREAMEAGDYETAERALGRAYAYGKTDTWKIERLFELADLHLTHTEERPANWPRALRSWNTVLNINPNNTQARREMMRYFYEMADSGAVGAWRNVHENAGELIDIRRNQDAEPDVETLNAYGRAALAIAQRGGAADRSTYLTQAKETFETLIERDPTNASYYARLADALLVQGAINADAGMVGARDSARRAAIEQLDLAIQKADNTAEALAARYLYELQDAGTDPDRIKELRTELEQHVADTDPDARLYTALSQAYELPGGDSAESELNRAIEAARQAHRLEPDAFEHGYRLTLLLYRKGSAFGDTSALADALLLAEELKTIDQTQDIPGPRQHQHLAYRNAVNTFLARYYLEQAFSDPDNRDAWIAKVRPVIDQIAEYFASSENPVVQQWQGMLALAEGQRDAGVRLLHRAYEQGKAVDIPDQPSNIDPVLCMTLARIAHENGQLGLQREYLEKALVNRTRLMLDKPELILDYAELMGNFGAWTPALRYAQTYQQRYGANDRSRRLITTAAIELNEDAIIDDITASLPAGSTEQKAVELRHISAQIARQSRQIAQLDAQQETSAETQLQDIAALRARQRELLFALIEAAPDKIAPQTLTSACIHYIRDDRAATAAELLDAYLAKKPESVQLQILRRQLDEPTPLSIPVERFVELQLDAIAELSDPKQRATAKASILRSQGDYDGALELLEEARNTDAEQDQDIVWEMFEIALEREDVTAAESLLRTIRSRNIDRCEGNLAAGRVEAAKGNYDVALRRLDECLTIQPMNSLAYHLKSRAHKELGNLEAALESSRQASQMDPLNGLYSKNYAAILFDRNTALGARVTGEQREELLQAITMAIHLNPTDWQLQSVFAEVISEQSPDRALAIRQQLLQSQPTVGNAIMLGNMAMRMARSEFNATKKTGLFELAGKAYGQALEMDPDNDNARAAWADYLRQTQQSEKAEQFLRDDKHLLWRYYLQNSQFNLAFQTLEQLYAENPDDISVLRGMVLTAEGAGDRVRRQQYLEQLAALEQDADGQVWVIQKYLDAGLVETADKMLASFKERYPEAEVAMLLEALSKMQRGRLDEAMTLTNRYLESDDTHAPAWRLRGRLYRLTGQQRRAVEDLQRSKGLAPNPDVSIELAMVYSELGQAEAAIGELVSGLQMPQAPLQMRTMLESLYQRYNRQGDLRRFYAETLDLYPDSPFWSLRAGRYYLSQEQPAEALPYFKRAWDALRAEDELDPTVLHLYLDTLNTLGQYSQAFTLASELIDTPLAAIAYAHMAQSQFHQGQRQRAEELFFSALDRSRSVDVFQDIALELIIATVGPQTATRWIERQPEELPALLLSYRLALHNEQYNRGLEFIDKCLAKSQPDRPEWGNLAMKKGNLLLQAYMKTADQNYMDRAIDLFSQFVQQYPNNPMILNNLAFMLASNDEQLETAMRYARRAHQQDPGNPTYLDTYAYTQFKNGLIQDAHSNLLRSIQLFEANRQPVPWEVYSHLGQVYEALDRPDEALDSYRRALDAAADAADKEQQSLQERIDNLR